MTSKTSLTRSGWATIVLCATALALGGCGRKGPLDLPPTASGAPATAQATSSDTETERASQPSLFNSTYGTDAAPAAPKGNKRPFILDPLLNSN
ncbi:LPS translocon maturation chaperone LptM [Bradyrhizobium genosp. P]|uniref:LPS translocon maturation chaperone LptM n=1 Tax=Bradyrhizobium genosp. P TaxID=83641 RepID=UPI003CF2375D